LGTLAAVVVIVLVAFFGTAIADIRTKATQLTMQIRVSCHEPSAQAANISAVTAVFNTVCHHLRHVTT